MSTDEIIIPRQSSRRLLISYLKSCLMVDVAIFGVALGVIIGVEINVGELATIVLALLFAILLSWLKFYPVQKYQPRLVIKNDRVILSNSILFNKYMRATYAIRGYGSDAIFFVIKFSNYGSIPFSSIKQVLIKGTNLIAVLKSGKKIILATSLSSKTSTYVLDLIKKSIDERKSYEPDNVRKYSTKDDRTWPLSLFEIIVLLLAVCFLNDAPIASMVMLSILITLPLTVSTLLSRSKAKRDETLA